MKGCTSVLFSQNETSTDDQQRICREYAERQGWRIIESYAETVSGAAFGNRPEFLRMRAAAMAGRFAVLLVTDTGRLTRSQELAPLIERLRFQRVRIIGVQDAFDSSTGTSDMQAGLTGIASVEFRRMVKARTHAALKIRAQTARATGGKAYAYSSKGELVPHEAEIVREIFERFAGGESYRAIAASLNARGVPSPGSAWKRQQRRGSGWTGSAIRAILFNERYAGRIRWNVSEWRKDPDTGRRQRVMRPRTDWISRVDESQRIVSDGLWDRPHRRRVRTGASDPRLKSGGRPKFLLSGLLICDVCNAHYVLDGSFGYTRGSYRDGAACSNGVRVRRDRAEHVLVDPIRDELLAPERVALMAREMQEYYSQQARVLQSRAIEMPGELAQLSARIERLRDRLRQGDPD